MQAHSDFVNISSMLNNHAPKADFRYRQTLNNAKLTGTLVDLIKAHGLEKGCSKEKGALVMMVGSTFPAAAMRHRPLLMDYILTDKIVTNDQCNGAMKYFKGIKDADVVVADLEKSAGVGIVVSDADVEAAVAKVLQDNMEALEAERYHFKTMKLLQPIKNIGDMAWADIAKVKAELARQTAALLGPKTAADDETQEKPKKTKAPKPEKVLPRPDQPLIPQLQQPKRVASALYVCHGHHGTLVRACLDQDLPGSMVVRLGTLPCSSLSSCNVLLNWEPPPPGAPRADPPAAR